VSRKVTGPQSVGTNSERPEFVPTFRLDVGKKSKAAVPAIFISPLRPRNLQVAGLWLFCCADCAKRSAPIWSAWIRTNIAGGRQSAPIASRKAKDHDGSGVHATGRKRQSPSLNEFWRGTPGAGSARFQKVARTGATRKQTRKQLRRVVDIAMQAWPE